jgi:hypothetical protein
MAEVLSPRDRMHSSTSPWDLQSSRTSQMVTAMARNSRTLLASETPWIEEDSGIRILQARPFHVNPPIPNGQESEMPPWEGLLSVRRFIDIPCRALSRKCTQSERSAISSLLKVISCWEFLTKCRRWRSRPKKCRDRGIT